MGVQDVVGYTVRKVKPNGTAGVIKCGSFILAIGKTLDEVAPRAVLARESSPRRPANASAGSRPLGAVFVIVAFSIAAAARREDVPNSLVSSMVVNGMKSSSPVVPWPQLTFCPFFEHGIITSISCVDSRFGDHENRTLTLHYTVLNSTWTSPKYPNNLCYAFNYAGSQIPTWDTTVHCRINSTSVDGNTTWPGRVRVFVDVPKTSNFDTSCANCVDGIDGTMLVAGYFTAAFWQGTLVDVNGAPVVDYKTSTERAPLKARAARRPVYDDIVFLGGFYTPDVWKFQDPNDFRAAIGGERFGEFNALIGGLGVIAWGIYACLSTTFILIVVGADGLGEKQRTPL